MGESYVITQAVYAAVVVLMMNPIRFTAEGVAKRTGEIILAVISLFLMNGFIYMTVGETHKNWLLLLIYIVLYAGIRSKYRYSTRVIMGSLFYSAAFLNIVISEPWGDLISALGFPAYGNHNNRQYSAVCIYGMVSETVSKLQYLKTVSRRKIFI